MIKNAVLGIGGAIIVLAAACGLGWLYQVGHHWLWETQHMWFPVLPGAILGFLIREMVRTWRAPLSAGMQWLAPLLALTAGVVVILVRLHLDGLAAGHASDPEWVRISHYLVQQSARRMAVVGAVSNDHAPGQTHWLYWTFLVLEFVALLFVALPPAPRRTLSVASATAAGST